MGNSIASNVLTGGPGNSKAAMDVFNAITPQKSNELGFMKALGPIRGDEQGIFGIEAINAANYNPNVTGTTPTCTNGAPTSTEDAALLLTTTATAHDGLGVWDTWDRGTTARSPFFIKANKNIRYSASVKVSALTSVGIWGLAAYIAGDGDIMDSSDASLIINGVYFISTVTTGALSLVIRKTNVSTQTVTDLGVSLVADTYMKLGFRINGTSSIDWWAGTKRGSITTMTNIPAVALGICAGLHTTSAAIKYGRIRALAAFQGVM